MILSDKYTEYIYLSGKTEDIILYPLKSTSKSKSCQKAVSKYLKEIDMSYCLTNEFLYNYY